MAECEGVERGRWRLQGKKRGRWLAGGEDWAGDRCEESSGDDGWREEGGSGDAGRL
jgi:hypothetical protein